MELSEKSEKYPREELRVPWGCSFPIPHLELGPIPVLERVSWEVLRLSLPAVPSLWRLGECAMYLESCRNPNPFLRYEGCLLP